MYTKDINYDGLFVLGFLGAVPEPSESSRMVPPTVESTAMFETVETIETDNSRFAIEVFPRMRLTGRMSITLELHALLFELCLEIFE